MNPQKILNAALVTLALAPGIASAGPDDSGLLSAAAETGYNAGAMRYCRERYATEDDDGRYKLLALSFGKDLDKLSGDEKVKALLVKKSVEEKGEWGNRKLSRRRCTSLRKTLGLGRALD